MAASHPHSSAPFFCQNHSNSDVISIDCSVDLAANEEVAFLLHGNLWIKSLAVVRARPHLGKAGHASLLLCPE